MAQFKKEKYCKKKVIKKTIRKKPIKKQQTIVKKPIKKQQTIDPEILMAENNKKIIKNAKQIQKTFKKPVIPTTYTDEVTTKANWDPKEFEEDYHTIPDRALSTATVDKYLNMLLKQGKKIKSLGKVLILPSKFFLMIYNPDIGYQNGQINDVDYQKHKNNYLNLNLDQTQRNNKAKMLIKSKQLLSYSVVFIPVWIIGHWVLFIINNAEIIYAYDSCFREYPDAVEAINSYLKQIENKELPVEYTTDIPGIKDYGNCGTFMLEYARNEMHEGKYNWTNFNIPGINKRIRKELETGKLVSKYKYEDSGAIAIGPYEPRKPENPEKLKHWKKMRKQALLKNQFIEN